ncbi:MAG: DNA-binding protein, partial [Thaumarchaeota archaeon]|nr:DNA-binding protein [Nitrososphaerota archaeon]
MPRKSNDRESTPSATVEKPAQMTEQPMRTTPAVGNQERRSPPNHIYIGKKPVMGYAMSALIQLTQMGEIIIKARGLAISRAVDVAQIVTKRLGN